MVVKTRTAFATPSTLHSMESAYNPHKRSTVLQSSAKLRSSILAVTAAFSGCAI